MPSAPSDGNDTVCVRPWTSIARVGISRANDVGSAWPASPHGAGEISSREVTGRFAARNFISMVPNWVQRSAGEDGPEACLQFVFKGLGRLRQQPPPRGRELDDLRAAAVRVGAAAAQASGLDAVHELARAADGDRQLLLDVIDTADRVLAVPIGKRRMAVVRPWSPAHDQPHQYREYRDHDRRHEGYSRRPRGDGAELAPEAGVQADNAVAQFLNAPPLVAAVMARQLATGSPPGPGRRPC